MKKKKTRTSNKTKPKRRKKIVQVKKAVSVSKSWRKFELLVSRIEQVLSPQGAKVTSPDYLIDKITGERREVDASIRYKIGTTEIIITIECRERVSPQDTTWIEQLATKQNNIGASKTIAVASSRFSVPAIKKAEVLGIELRILKEIDDGIITQWSTLTRIQHNYKIVSATINIDCPDDIKQTITNELIAKGSGCIDVPLFLYKVSSSNISLRNIFEEFLRRAQPKMPKNTIPETGESGVYTLECKLLDREFTYTNNSGTYFLVGFTIEYTLYKFEELVSKPSSTFDYADAENSLVQGVEFELESKSGQKELVTFHADLKARTGTLSVWRESEQ